MDVIHFPDDPRPARWVQPVLALGNFDGLHRGHIKIIERVQRRAGERGGDLGRHDVRPASAARRAARQGAAAAHDHGAAARGARRGRACRGRPSCASRRELSQWDPETFVRTVLVEWLHVAEVWVGANFLFGHERAGNFSACCARSARATGSAPRRSTRSATRSSSSASTRIRRLIAEGRVDEAGALLGHHYVIDGTVVEGRAARPRRSGSRRRTCETENELVPPARRLRDDRHASTASSTRRSPTSAMRPDLRRRAGAGDRDARPRPRSRPVRPAPAPRVRAAAAGRAAVRRGRGAGRADRADSERARALFDRMSL